MSASPVQSLSAFVTASKQIAYPGSFHAPRRVLRVHIEVIEAFNGGGTDQIRVGHRTDDDAYATLVDVSTTGIKTVTLGSGVGFDATPREVIVEYVNGGGEPTTGSALVTMEFIPCPPQIS